MSQQSGPVVIITLLTLNISHTPFSIQLAIISYNFTTLFTRIKVITIFATKIKLVPFLIYDLCQSTSPFI